MLYRHRVKGEELRQADKPFSRLAAEFLGTFILVFVGCGAVPTASILGGGVLGYTVLIGIALAFGLALYAGIHTPGPLSGAHFNPVVSLGMCVAGRLPWLELPGYVLAQSAGASAASALHLVLAGGLEHDLGATRIGDFGIGAALVSKIALTFLLMYVILTATSHGRDTKAAAFPIAFYLAGASLVGFPFSATSLNPARSLAPALFVGGGALAEMWLFTLGPAAGALLAVLVWRLVEPRGNAAATASILESSPTEQQRTEHPAP